MERSPTVSESSDCCNDAKDDKLDISDPVLVPPGRGFRWLKCFFKAFFIRILGISCIISGDWPNMEVGGRREHIGLGISCVIS